MHNPTCGTLVPAVRHRLRGRRRRSWCSNIFVATQYLFISQILRDNRTVASDGGGAVQAHDRSLFEAGLG